ncbi:hypothetical protein U9M48_011372 [Paspalum notatum var. saurae]|uniref:Uncharacterized protein n=1 Tax=Paspalum notatum var. saurae TaxID=547442 RepID=A0AAQ3WHJ0_PASNO
MEGAAAEAGRQAQTSCSCLGRAAVPVKRVWRGLSARLLRLRRRRRSRTTTGLGRLSKEVRTCEYSDVHVMWEMLLSTGGVKAKAAAAAATTTTRPRAAAAWSRLASYCSLS